MNEIIFTVKDSPEGGYEAEALGHSIFTEADDMEAMKKSIRDAVFCHFEDQDDRPKIVRLHYVNYHSFTQSNSNRNPKQNPE